MVCLGLVPFALDQRRIAFFLFCVDDPLVFEGVVDGGRIDGMVFLLFGFLYAFVPDWFFIMLLVDSQGGNHGTLLGKFRLLFRFD